MPPRRVREESPRSTGPGASSSTDLTESLRQLTQLTQTIGAAVLNGNNGGGDVSRKITGRNPPCYLGQEDPEVLESWIRTFDKLLDVVGCPEDKQVEAAVYYLQGEADHWWVTEGPTVQAREGFDWEMFKMVLRERFYLEHVKAAKYEEFLHLEQGSSTVQECHARFVALSRFAPTLAPDEKSFSAARFATLTEAYDAAAGYSRLQQLHRDAMQGMKKKNEGVDSHLNKGHRFNPTSRFDNRGRERRNMTMRQGVGAGGPPSERVSVCPRCGKDHPRTTCGALRVVCFQCGKSGHRAATCRSPRTEGSHGTIPSQPPRGPINQAPNQTMGRGYPPKGGPHKNGNHGRGGAQQGRTRGAGPGRIMVMGQTQAGGQS
ncbi:PREDICTED: uncharacterized protein LOC109153454 [Ipomoea nil]|uniref:uncharacterized protein LOC109153454 n=1 Tax=Ipomoea nil TaxID=35883 RepID=UPI000901A79C|nr:PREDICTED: uncharacterized protein LOC109153454 [Ipomoea nil]